jgi:hypothetical protein
MTDRIIIPVTPTMTEQISEFWHKRRMKSKSEAVRHLIEVGLAAERASARHRA